MVRIHQICKACGTALAPSDKFCPKCLVKVPEIEVLPLKDTSKKEGVDRDGGFSADFYGFRDIFKFFGLGQRRPSPQPGADPLKRTLKDTSNKETKDQGGGFSADFSGFGDIFDFFGGDQRRPSPQPGADLLKRIQISRDDAVAGMDREIEVLHTEFCHACNGTGNRSKQLNACPKCEGTGRKRKVSHSFLGQFIRLTPCSECRGTGKAQETICKECRGSGHIRVKRQVSLHIPAGVSNGTRYRMEGWGECGDYGQKKGDLFIDVNIK